MTANSCKNGLCTYGPVIFLGGQDNARNRTKQKNRDWVLALCAETQSLVLVLSPENAGWLLALSPDNTNV